eukprot:gene16657-21063_t
MGYAIAGVEAPGGATAAAAGVIDLASPALQRTTVAKGSTSAATDTSVAAMASSPSHSSTIRTTPLFERLKKISGRQLRRPPTISEAPVQSSSWELPMVLDDADDGDVEPPPPIAVATTATATATVTMLTTKALAASADVSVSSPFPFLPSDTLQSTLFRLSPSHSRDSLNFDLSEADVDQLLQSAPSQSALWLGPPGTTAATTRPLQLQAAHSERSLNFDLSDADM